ncbi:hypothetical protein AT6N2_C0290 [Agrobacterium tumefaciens]|nr:hypothetical protein AT6N2_C0290 [Agrobacterium tumefaciens]
MRHVVDEGRAFFNRAELQAPADVGADIDIRGGKEIAGDKAVFTDGPLQRIHHIRIAAAAGHAQFFLGDFETHRLHARRHFQRARGEEHPAVIEPARFRRGRKVRAGKGICQIGADCCGLGDDGIAMFDGGYLRHRIDQPIGGRLHRGFETQYLGSVGYTHFFKHPAGNAAARHGVRVKDQFTHAFASPSKIVDASWKPAGISTLRSTLLWSQHRLRVP